MADFRGSELDAPAGEVSAVLNALVSSGAMKEGTREGVRSTVNLILTVLAIRNRLRGVVG